MAVEIAPLDLSTFWKHHPVLETERLILRPFTLADAEGVYEFGCDPEVNKYSVYPLYTSITDAIQWLETVPVNFEKKERINFAIALKPEGKCIGSCGFHHISPEHHRLQIGFVLTRSAWGNGYMIEAAGEMIRFAFEEMRMHRVEGSCDFENERSVRVMERCGMKHEGTFKDDELRHGRFITTKMYAIVH